MDMVFGLWEIGEVNGRGADEMAFGDGIYVTQVLCKVELF